MVTMCMLAMLAFSMAQTIKGKNMERKEKTIRLVYPQWQGGHVDVFIPEIKDTTAASSCLSWFRAMIQSFRALPSRFHATILSFPALQ